MLHEYHVIRGVRYYPRFYATAVGLGTYCPCVRGQYFSCRCICNVSCQTSQKRIALIPTYVLISTPQPCRIPHFAFPNLNLIMILPIPFSFVIFPRLYSYFEISPPPHPPPRSKESFPFIYLGQTVFLCRPKPQRVLL
jgi:hypothetical protein